MITMTKTLKMWVTLAGAAIVALVGVSAIAQVAPVSAASSADAITYGTECGAPGAGRRVGTTEIVRLTAEESKGLQVGPDGFWRWCAPPALTPGTRCGAPGVGIGPDGATYSWTRPGYRVNVNGRWEACDRPCIPPADEISAFRVWAVGDNVCTTYVRYASGAEDRARNRVLAHDAIGFWEQWLGGMRGHLIERCHDGMRTVIGATCAPATHCDQLWRDVDTGAIYNARPESARVPLNGFAEATSPSGDRVRIQCVGGNFVKAPQCAAGQTVVRYYSWQARYYRYGGPPVDVGERVRAEQTHVVDTRSGERSAGANKIRSTMAVCSHGGVLQ